MQQKSLQLIWIVKTTEELTWFAQLVCDLYHKVQFYCSINRKRLNSIFVILVLVARFIGSVSRRAVRDSRNAEFLQN